MDMVSLMRRLHIEGLRTIMKAIPQQLPHPDGIAFSSSEVPWRFPRNQS
jgi:hypothetical protein